MLGNAASDNGVANSTVLGMKASIAAGTPGSNVALGQGSVAASGALSGYAAYGLSSQQSAIGEVSVGSAGAERRITNLAAGLSGEPLDHEEVLEAGRAAASRMGGLLSQVTARI